MTEHRIALVVARPEGFDENGWQRPSFYGKEQAGAIILAAWRENVSEARGRGVEYVLVKHDSTVWGVGKVLGLSTPGSPQCPTSGRRFIVDPTDVPQHLLALVGRRVPDSGRTVRYGVVTDDGTFTLD